MKQGPMLSIFARGLGIAIFHNIEGTDTLELNLFSGVTFRLHDYPIQGHPDY